MRLIEIDESKYLELSSMRLDTLFDFSDGRISHFWREEELIKVHRDGSTVLTSPDGYGLRKQNKHLSFKFYAVVEE